MKFLVRKQSQFSLFYWLYDRFTQLIIYPSIWVAAAIASLGIYTQEVLNLGHNWQAIALIFTSALIPYNLDRIIDSYVQKNPNHKAQLFFRQPCILILLLTAIIATVILLFYAPSQVKYASTIGLIPLLYGMPFFPIKDKFKWQWYRLKDIPGSKAWIVGSILTYAVIVLPLAYVGKDFNFEALIITIFMFVFIVTNSHIFDIRDVESDKHKGVLTLPIMVGIRNTKIILTTINILVLIILACTWTIDQLFQNSEIIVAIVVNLIYIWQIKIDTPRWVYSIWIEGCLFVPFLGNWMTDKLFNYF